ncbi:hypothetical protein [Alkaliflexus imshenetskii]|uniref:hypothetical protein n=1 Tax=Alkaliflexus imshenetskii TaxID=286730 RepID=UPI00047C481E|nr:hypothetical protein [Alkaliflexus imshenetskii]
MKKGVFTMFIGMSILLFACNTGNEVDKLYASWKVTDMKVDIPNVPPQLITNAKILALSTTYEFRNDNSFCMTIASNELDNGRRQVGTMSYSSNSLTLNTDSLFFERNGVWTNIEKSDFNKPYFKSMQLQIEKIIANQLLVAEKEVNGVIYYTLQKIE